MSVYLLHQKVCAVYTPWILRSRAALSCGVRLVDGVLAGVARVLAPFETRFLDGVWGTAGPARTRPASDPAAVIEPLDPEL